MSDTDWIYWQRACDAMQAEILKEVRKLFKGKAVCTHKEIDALICEVTHPQDPRECPQGSK